MPVTQNTRSAQKRVAAIVDRWRRILSLRDELLKEPAACPEAQGLLKQIDAAILKGPRAIDSILIRERSNKLDRQAEAVDNLLNSCLSEGLLEPRCGTTRITLGDGTVVLNEQSHPLSQREDDLRVVLAIRATLRKYPDMLSDLSVSPERVLSILLHEDVTVGDVTAPVAVHLKTKGKAKARAAFLALVHEVDPRTIETYQPNQTELDQRAKWNREHRQLLLGGDVERVKAFESRFGLTDLQTSIMRLINAPESPLSDGRRNDPPIASPNGS